MDRETILEHYRCGDEGKRLGLFLAFRDLRDSFSLIEQESPNDDLTIVKPPWSKEHPVAQAA